MNLAIRLNWQHDPDLIGLSVHPEFNLSKAIKEVLCAYTKGEYFTIRLPGALPPRTEIKNCTIHISLGEKADADVIKKILEVRSGFRNTAIKNLFRTYLENIYLYPISVEADVKIANRVSKQREDMSRKPDDLSEAALEAETKRIEVKKSETVRLSEKTKVKPETANENKQTESRTADGNKPKDAEAKEFYKGKPNYKKKQNQTLPPRERIIKEPETVNQDTVNQDEQTDDFDLFGAIGKIGGSITPP